MSGSVVHAPADAGSPLAGAGILITRPARQAGALAQRVAAIGGHPVVFPAIVILPPADPGPLQRAHAALAQYDYAVFVSPNAAEFGAPDARRWPARLVAFAPGHGTAEALADVGIANVRVPDTTQDSAGLLALPEMRDVRGRRVVIFRGDGGREELTDALRARGATVDHVPCYARARPSDAKGLQEAFAAKRIDAVSITSSEGLHNVWSLLDTATRTRWSGVTTFVPHERIESAAQALGLPTIRTEPGDAGLLAALLNWAALPH